MGREDVALIAVLLACGIAAAGNVGFVVQYDDARFDSRCVAVTDGESAADALARAGFDLQIADFGWGKAVCGIEGVGCPASNCWCGGASYWSLKQRSGSGWTDASVGISDVRVNGGDMIGLRWGAFGAQMAEPPDPCAGPAAAKPGSMPDVQIMNASLMRVDCRLVGVTAKTSEGSVVPFALVRVLRVEDGGTLKKVAERESDGEGNALFGALTDGAYRIQVLYPNSQPFEENVQARECGEENLMFAAAQQVKEPTREDIKQYTLVDMVGHALASFEEGWNATGWIHTGWGESKRWQS